MNLSFILSEMPSEDGRPQTPPSVAAPGAGRARPHVVVQFVKFGIVGVSNTLLTFIVYTILLKGFDVWYLAASAIGFIAGATNGFLLNRRWTFSDHVGDALTPVRWAVVQSTGLAINIGLLYLFVHEAGIDELLAQALTIGVVTVITFLANRAWTFRVHHHEAAVAVAEGDAPS
jgi:putative flippase GtrA